jgi:hypothetical protein
MADFRVKRPGFIRWLKKHQSPVVDRSQSSEGQGMDVVAVVISGLSLVVAAVGTLLSNRRSLAALEESQKAASTALWSAVQEAVQRLIGFDPTAEPVGDRLTNLRIAMIALIDELDDWDEFDGWLAAEHVLGAALGRQVMEAAQPGDNVEERLAQLEPLMRWAVTLSNNLRLFRSRGYDAEAAAKLRLNAERLVKSVHQKHGWEQPPTTIPGVTPLG